MERLTTLEGFHALHDQLKGALDPNAKIVTICGGTGCAAFGALPLQAAFEAEIEKQGAGDQVSVKMTGCHGFCEKGPVVVILPSKAFYPNETPMNCSTCSYREPCREWKPDQSSTCPGDKQMHQTAEAPAC